MILYSNIILLFFLCLLILHAQVTTTIYLSFSDNDKFIRHHLFVIIIIIQHTAQTMPLILKRSLISVF